MTFPTDDIIRLAIAERDIKALTKSTTEDIAEIKVMVRSVDDKLTGQLQTVNDKLAGRPSWPLLILLSAMSGLIVALAGALASGITN